MVEIHADEDNKRRVSRTPSMEFQGPFNSLNRLTSDEVDFEAEWVNVYFGEYLEADKFRAEGDHKSALEGFKRARQIIYEAKERGCDEQWILVREATLHYMIIQCYTNLQKDPDVVMREFHNFGVVLNDFIELTFSGKPEMQVHLDELRQIHIDENYIKIEILLEKLSTFNDTQQDLSPKELEVLWLCAYFFTRFTNSIHDFFLRSTALIDIARKYQGICKTAGKIARSALRRIPEDHINANKSLVIYKGLMKWLDGFDDHLIREISSELGEEEGSGPASKDTRSTIEINALQLNVANIDKDDPSERRGYEFALEISVQNIFDEILKEESNYLRGVINLKTKANEAADNGFKRVAIKAYILICRAALQYDCIKDAKSTLDQLKSLKQTDSSDLNKETHIFDRWVMVLSAEVMLLEYNAEKDIDDVSAEQRSRARDTIDLIEIRDTHPLKQIDQIEAIFARYRIDNESKPPNLSYKVIDAKIYHILGKVAIEKIKLLGAKFTVFELKDKNFTQGHELLQAFIDATRYLCEAHLVLDDMQFKGTALKDKITATYEELVNLNYDIFGTRKRDQKGPAEKKKSNVTVDMKEVTRDYHMQKITRMLYSAFLKEADGFESALNEILQVNFPTISNVTVVEKVAEDPLHAKAIENFKNGRTINYFYHLPDGTITEVIQLDDDLERYLVIDTDIKLTGNSRDVILEMIEGIKQKLRIQDLRPQLDALKGKDDDESKQKYETLKTQFLNAYKDLNITLLRRHKPTLNHSLAIAEMLEQDAIDLRGQGYDVDPMVAYISGLTHDNGKIFKNNQMLWNIARRFMDFEREEMKDHIEDGLVLDLAIVGFEHCPELACLKGAHHVKYGFSDGYPFVAPGKRIRGIKKQINMVAGLKPGDDDYMEGELSEGYCKLARLLALNDTMQALRSKERLYRQGPRPIDDLISSIISRAGSEFDPDAVLFRLKQLKEGKHHKLLVQSDDDVEFLFGIEVPEKAYEWEDVWEFVNFAQDELERLCGVQLDIFLGELMKGMLFELKMTPEVLGRSICGVMIEELGRAEGIAKYDEISDEFFRKFKAWASA